jgi:hypothetical protein
MILLWPLTLALTMTIAWRRRRIASGRGVAPLVGWAAAGALFAFSFVTGFTVGLFLLPLAGIGMLVLAYRSPSASGLAAFLLGLTSMALVVAATVQ